MAEKFEKEFDEVFQNQLLQGSQIFLLDILEDMYFLDSEKVGKSFGKIESILNSGGQNLIIELKGLNK